MNKFENLYNNMPEKTQKIDETFIEINNTKGFKEAIEYLISIDAKWFYGDSYKCMYFINEFTKSNIDDEAKKKNIEDLVNLKEVNYSKIEYDESLKLPKVIIKTDEVTIEAIELSKRFPKVLEILPDLETKKRVGTCYSKAYNISRYAGIPNKIVTGYIYGVCDKSRFIHSWVETVIDGKEVVIDGTNNIIMNKEGYYYLRHAEAVTIIDNKTLDEDIDKYFKNIKMPLSIYLFFRNEIVEDLRKNDVIFKGVK